MKNYKIFVGLLGAALAGAGGSPHSARAHGGGRRPAAAAAPSWHGDHSSVDLVSDRTRREGPDWLKAEVVHADAVTLIVRERDEWVRRFTPSILTACNSRCRQILDKGGFQYGDKVRILYMPGQTVALAFTASLRSRSDLAIPSSAFRAVI